MRLMRIHGFCAVALGVAISSAGAAERTAAIEIGQGIVLASPQPGGEVAAYAVFKNRGSATAIAAAECECADSLEFHIVDRQNPGRAMNNSWPLDLPAGSNVAIEPPGVPRHMMLVGLRRPIAVGEKLALRFQLTDGRWIDGSFTAVANSKDAWRALQAAAE